MDELIRQVSERSGISEDQARTAVNTVLGYIKGRIPAPLGAQLDNLVGAGAGAAGDVANRAGDVIGGLGGMFGGGKKE
jgi:hypothetical protein